MINKSVYSNFKGLMIMMMRDLTLRNIGNEDKQFMRNSEMQSQGFIVPSLRVKLLLESELQY